MDEDLKRKLIATAAAAAVTATGVVFIGLVAGPMIGVGAGYLTYRLLGPGGDTPPSSDPTINPN